MIRSAIISDRAYLELTAAGAKNNQIAPWIKRPDGVAVPTLTALAPLNEPLAPLNEALAPLDIPLAPPGSALPSVFSDMRIQSDRLKALGIITDAGGQHMRAAIGPDGRPGFQVVTQAEVDEITQNDKKDIGAQLSEAAVGELHVQMRKMRTA